jgi:hypothetical protein
MRTISFLFFIGILIAVISCRTDFETVANSGDLKFSRNTVFLDTVFSNISSSTYTLKVYNQSNDDITIPTIQLGKALNSKYRMTVDGMTGVDDDKNGIGDGKTFNNVTLLAKDSLYIFIETTAKITDASPTDFLYTDQILFDSGTNLQKVELVTLIQDAVFLYPQKFSDGSSETLPNPSGGDRLPGFVLDEKELIFTKEKPYVIYGYAGVPSGKTVTFDAGARVHFHVNSGLIIPKNSSINVNGTVSPNLDKPQENEVIFESDRLEPEYSDVPGQWGAIWLTNGSTNNIINNLTIKNATIGLLIQNNDGSTVQIKNTQIYNSSNYGILAQTARIEGENIVINNAGKASLACTYGGDYKFTHCTFNNNWNSSTQVAVLINNYYVGADPEVKNLTGTLFNNCIIYGSSSNELIVDKQTGDVFEYQFNNCLIKFNNTSNSLTNHPEYQFNTDPTHYNKIILNKAPKFFNIDQNKFNIDKTSSAFEKGSSSYTIPSDIIGNTRASPPDLGAYQNKDFPVKK